VASIVSYVVKPSPKKSEIVEDIRRRIISGEFLPGAQLPTVAQMQEQYDASPVTVRRAVSHLREHGFLYTEERSGAFVAEDPPCLCNIGLVRPLNQRGSQFLTALENEVRHFSETKPSPAGLRRRFSFFNAIDGPEEDTQRHHRDLFSAVDAETVGGLIFAGPMFQFAGSAVLGNPHVPCVGLMEHSVDGVITFRLTGFHERALDFLALRGRRRIAFITRLEEAGRPTPCKPRRPPRR
jgi:DNA-binding transcriptional regulator YhcF (GntR family)